MTEGEFPCARYNLLSFLGNRPGLQILVWKSFKEILGHGFCLSNSFFSESKLNNWIFNDRVLWRIEYILHSRWFCETWIEVLCDCNLWCLYGFFVGEMGDFFFSCNWVQSAQDLLIFWALWRVPVWKGAAGTEEGQHNIWCSLRV